MTGKGVEYIITKEKKRRLSRYGTHTFVNLFRFRISMNPLLWRYNRSLRRGFAESSFRLIQKLIASFVIRIDAFSGVSVFIIRSRTGDGSISLFSSHVLHAMFFVFLFYEHQTGFLLFIIYSVLFHLMDGEKSAWIWA